MSGPDNLADSFGPPARSLSTMLPPRRRRSAREPNRPAAVPDRPEMDNDEDREQTPGAGEARPSAPRALSTEDPTPPSRDDDPETAPRAPRAAEADPMPAAAGRPSTTARRTTPRTGSKTAAPITVDDQTSYQVVVYVHPSAKSVATTQRREQKVSNAEIAFDAIDAVQHRLDGLIKTRRLQRRPDSSLFPGRVRRGRVSGGGAAATAGDARRVLWGFRATGQELAVIDRLVERTGAESRSELVATALEEVLLQAAAPR